MASMNRVTIIGNLGSDPEVRYLDSGACVARFNVATTEKYTNKAGEKVEQTEWHRIELWDAQAKVAEQYLKKGSPVCVEGKLKTETWTDKDGQEKSVTRIRGNNMIMLGGRNEGNAAPAQAAAPAAAPKTVQANPKPANAPAKRSPQPAPAGFDGGGDDDLPF